MHLFTLYLQDGTYLQKLIQPTTDSGQKRTVQDLLDDFGTPVRKAGKNSSMILFCLVTIFASK